MSLREFVSLVIWCLLMMVLFVTTLASVLYLCAFTEGKSISHILAVGFSMLCVNSIGWFIVCNWEDFNE